MITVLIIPCLEFIFPSSSNPGFLLVFASREEKELLTSITLEQDSDPDAVLRSKSNPFQDLAHDKKATVFQKGFLKRKAHADIDGKRSELPLFDLA